MSSEQRSAVSISGSSHPLAGPAAASTAAATALLSSASAAANSAKPAFTLSSSASLSSSSSSASSSSSSAGKGANLADSMRFFLAGNLAGMMGVVVGQPFDTVKVRMQTQRQLHDAALQQLKRTPASLQSSVYVPPLFPGALSCGLSTVRSGGFLSLYRGLSSPLLAVGVQKSVAFGVYGTVAQHLQGSKSEATLGEVWIASVAGGIANSLVLTPVDQLKIALQIQRYDAQALSKPSLLSTASSLISSQGFLSGIFGNFRATVLREIPMYSTYYTTYVWLNRHFSSHKNRESGEFPLLAKLCFGGLTGLFCWASCYPLDLIKSSMQAQTAKNTPKEDRLNVRRMISYIWRTGGIAAFYRGAPAAMLRAVPVHATVLTSYDLILKWTQT